MCGSQAKIFQRKFLTSLFLSKGYNRKDVLIIIFSSLTTSPWWPQAWSLQQSLQSWNKRELLAESGTHQYHGPWPWSGGDHYHHRNHHSFIITRSTDDGVVINEKKEVVNQLARFQSSLEKIDSYHHAVIPPFYRQVSMSMCECVRRSTCTTIPSYRQVWVWIWIMIND